MKKIRTTELHYNSYGDSWEKNVGKIYEVEDDIADKIVAAGIAESAEDKPKK